MKYFAIRIASSKYAIKAVNFLPSNTGARSSSHFKFIDQEMEIRCENSWYFYHYYLIPPWPFRLTMTSRCKKKRWKNESIFFGCNSALHNNTSARNGLNLQGNTVSYGEEEEEEGERTTKSSQKKEESRSRSRDESRRQERRSYPPAEEEDRYRQEYRGWSEDRNDLRNGMKSNQITWYFINRSTIHISITTFCLPVLGYKCSCKS